MGSQDPQRSQTFPGTLRRAVGMRPQTEGRLQHLSGSGPWIRRTHKGEGPVLLCGQKPTGAWGEGGYSLTTLRACPARASEKRRVTPPPTPGRRAPRQLRPPAPAPGSWRPAWAPHSVPARRPREEGRGGFPALCGPLLRAGRPGCWAAPLQTTPPPRRERAAQPRAPTSDPATHAADAPSSPRAAAGLGRWRREVWAAVRPSLPLGPPRTSWRPPAAGSIFNPLTGGGPAPGFLA